MPAFPPALRADDGVPCGIRKILENLNGGQWLLIAVAVIGGILYLGSRLGGWRRLAERYPAREPYRGEWISQPDSEGEPRGLTVALNHGESEDAIKLGADSRGLHMAMSLGFRLFHPPIFVPWSEVRGVRVQELPWTGKNLVRITFAACPEIPLDVDRRVAREIERLSMGRWAVPPE